MPESSVQLLPLVLAIVIPVIILLILGLIIFVHCRRRKSRIRSKKNGKNNHENNHEMERLLDKSGQPLSFYKAFDYGDNNMFCKTKCFTDAVGKLQTFGCITLIGPPGCGKTMTAVQLARHVRSNVAKTKLCFCQTFDEIAEKAKEENACIVADNFLDRYVYYPSKVNDEKEKLIEIFTDNVKRRLIHIIFTVQEDRWNMLQGSFSGHGMFNSKCLLSLKDDSFTTTDLDEMITSHFKYHKISENVGEENYESDEKTFGDDTMFVSSNTKTEIATSFWEKGRDFPLPVMVDIICKNRRLMLSRDLVFKDGIRYILREFFLNWKKAEDKKESLCILVFIALRGGMVSLADFQSTITVPNYERLCSEFKCSHSIESVKELLGGDVRLKGCLFQVGDCTENATFVFHHDLLLDFVLKFITTEIKSETFLIENANADILLSKCWIIGIFNRYIAAKLFVKLNPPTGSICLSPTSLKRLAERIHSEVQKGFALHEWPKHVFLNNETFYKIWKVCAAPLTNPESPSNNHENEEDSNTGVMNKDESIPKE